MTRGFIEDDRYGFEETTYLLLFGKLPNEEELEDFTKLLVEPALPSYEFRKGRYHESTVQGHYECSVQKCAYTLLL